jgi:hypothetical protein
MMAQPMGVVVANQPRLMREKLLKTIIEEPTTKSSPKIKTERKFYTPSKGRILIF